MVKKAKAGESYNDGCRNCRCSKSGGMCNKKACPNMCMYKHWSGVVGYAKVGGKKWLKVDGKDCRKKCKCVVGPKKSLVKKLIGQGKRGTKLKCTKRCWGEAKKKTRQNQRKSKRNKRKSKRNKRKSKRKDRRKKRKNRKRKKSKRGSPTLNPSTLPTASPTALPTNNPTSNPTVSPTSNPTQNPTKRAVRLTGLQKTRYVNDWDKPLSYTAGKNRMITGIHSVHDNLKEDRRFGFYSMAASGFSCTPRRWTGFVNGLDKQFVFQCPANHVMDGVYAVHDNGKEDRRFKFRCCKLSNASLRKGALQNANDWDKPFDFRCKNGWVLTAIRSKHDNGKEDRRFAFHCSRIY